MKKLIVILYNIRSTYNVGAILRTCDCLGVEEVIFTGYTPFLDKGLPHEQAKLKKQIHKTALGAEETVNWSRNDDIYNIIEKCQADGLRIVALEQGANSQNMAEARHSPDLARLLGDEVPGSPPEIHVNCDQLYEIPMCGNKESFNVSVATGIALWEIRKNSLNDNRNHLRQ